MKDDRDRRIAELEDELNQAKGRMDELRQERDAGRDLVRDLREHVQKDLETIDRWIAVFRYEVSLLD